MTECQSGQDLSHHPGSSRLGQRCVRSLGLVLLLGPADGIKEVAPIAHVHHKSHSARLFETIPQTSYVIVLWQRTVQADFTLAARCRISKQGFEAVRLQAVLVHDLHCTFCAAAYAVATVDNPKSALAQLGGDHITLLESLGCLRGGLRICLRYTVTVGRTQFVHLDRVAARCRGCRVLLSALGVTSSPVGRFICGVLATLLFLLSLQVSQRGLTHQVLIVAISYQPKGTLRGHQAHWDIVEASDGLAAPHVPGCLRFRFVVLVRLRQAAE
mmetsp:Transcript_34510/g.80144  ORF Transcript_34510/g.80144 Transcript_34510/m.80144 type:complete len:271 (+) Transcript_34510:617-1429(+)